MRMEDGPVEGIALHRLVESLDDSNPGSAFLQVSAKRIGPGGKHEAPGENVRLWEDDHHHDSCEDRYGPKHRMQSRPGIEPVFGEDQHRPLRIRKVIRV